MHKLTIAQELAEHRSTCEHWANDEHCEECERDEEGIQGLCDCWKLDRACNCAS